MKVILRGLAGAFGVLLCATVALVALLVLAPGAVGTRAAEWAGTRIGRSLALQGPVELELGRTIRLRAGGLRVGNASWGSRPDLLTTGRIAIALDGWSLVDGPLRILQVEVDGVDLLLERTAQGGNNWELDWGSREAPFAWPENPPAVIEEIDLPGAQLRFIGPRLTQPLEARFDSLSQRRGADGILTLAGRGRANDIPFDVQGRGGTVAALLTGRDFEVSLAGRIGEVTLDARAAVDDLGNPRDSRLVFDVRGPDADYLASRLGIRNLGAGAFDLHGEAIPAPDGGGLQGTLAGRIGGFEVRASGRLVEPAKPGRLALQIDVSGPDLSLVGGLAGVERLPASPFELVASLERSGERLRIADARLVLPDSRLELTGTIERLQTLEGNDLEFRFEGADVARFRQLLGLPGLAQGPFAMTGRLRRASDGAEQLELQADTALGRARVSGAIGPAPDYYGTRLDFEASGDNLQRVGRAAGYARLPAASFVARGNAEWQAAGLVLRNSTLRAGRDELGLDGRLGRDPLSRDTDLRFSLKGRDLAALGRLAGLQALPGGEYAVRGRLRRVRAASRLDEVRGTIAGATLDLRGRVADDFDADTDVVVAIEGPRLEAFAGLAKSYPLPRGRFRFAGGIALTRQKLELRNLRLLAGGAEGTLRASIARPLSLVRGQFAVSARGPDLSRLVPQLGRARPLVSNFELEVSGNARGGSWVLDAARLVTEAGSLRAEGRLDWAPDFSATALKLEARAASLAEVGRLGGAEWPAEPFEFTAELTGTPTALQVTRADGRLGATDFDGRATLELRARPFLDLEFQSELLDLTPFLDEPRPDAGQDGGRHAIPDVPLPLALLDRFDGSVAVQAGRALLAGVALDDMRMILRLQGGTARLDAFEMRAPPDGRVTLQGALQPQPGGASLRLAATGKRVPLSALSDTPAERAARPRADFVLEVSGRGATLREMVRTLDGRLRLSAGAGEVPATTTARLLGNLRRDLVKSVRPGASARRSGQLRCMAAAVTASGGVLRSAPVVALQTRDTNVVTHGIIDLRTEALDLYFSTTPRGRLDLNFGEIVNPYVKVTGTLGRPSLTVDPKGALFNGAAAFVTAGLSVVAKSAWERAVRDDDPCTAALAAADRLAEEGAASRPTLEALRRGPGKR